MLEKLTSKWGKGFVLGVTSLVSVAGGVVPSSRALANNYIDSVVTSEKTEHTNTFEARLKLEEEYAQINTELERLMHAHLDGVVTREEYLPRKAQLLHQKAEVLERLAKVYTKSNY